MTKIKSIKYVGKKPTCDLEIAHKDHQFFMSNGILTSNSHSVSYCILAYQCAYLLTYYTDEWICAHIDHESSDKGKAAGKTDPKIVAIGEAQKLGYKIGAPDINESDVGFSVQTNEQTGIKTLIPSISSLKYVGKSALTEIKANRPYENTLDLLVDHTGQWRHTRFNKRSLATMLKTEALGSMNIIGQDKMFPNYRVAYEVLFENYDLLKKTNARKKNNNIVPIIKDLIEKNKELPDWSSEEKMKFLMDLSGTLDRSLLLPEEIRRYLLEDNILPLDVWSDKYELYWAMVSNSEIRTTKTGKPYLWLSLVGQGSAQMTCMVWNWPNDEPAIPVDSTIVSMFDKDGAFKTTYKNIRKIMTQKQ